MRKILVVLTCVPMTLFWFSYVLYRRLKFIAITLFFLPRDLWEVVKKTAPAHKRAWSGENPGASPASIEDAAVWGDNG